jgi:hypothetical protein
MATDKHYNEPGVMPEPLEDKRGTDMPATRLMFIVIAALAVLAAVVLIVIQMASR